jgi:hypothetical protein
VRVCVFDVSRASLVGGSRGAHFNNTSSVQVCRHSAVVSVVQDVIAPIGSGTLCPLPSGLRESLPHPINIDGNRCKHEHTSRTGNV